MNDDTLSNNDSTMNSNILYQYVNGKLVPLTAEEAAEYAADRAAWLAGGGARLAADIRQQRDNLLRDSDIALLRALEDGADTSIIRAYRQSLRDIPLQPGFPTTVLWPKFTAWP